MCQNCWVEEGSPSIINHRTKRAAVLVERLYETEHCGAGGIAHIVTDDWNVRDSDIEYCINDANSDYEGSKEALQAALKVLNYFLKRLSINERYSALAIYDGLIKL